MNWKNFWSELNLLTLAFVTVNVGQSLNNGFSWLGLLVMVSGFAFVISIVTLRNMEEKSK
jgi:hypothetical protein